MMVMLSSQHQPSPPRFFSCCVFGTYLLQMDPKDLEAFLELQHLEQRQFELFCERFGEISGMTNGAGGGGVSTEVKVL